MAHDRRYGVADPLREILARRRGSPRKNEFEGIRECLQSRGFMRSQDAALQRMNEAATSGRQKPSRDCLCGLVPVESPVNRSVRVPILVAIGSHFVRQI